MLMWEVVARFLGMPALSSMRSNGRAGGDVIADAEISAWAMGPSAAGRGRELSPGCGMVVFYM